MSTVLEVTMASYLPEGPHPYPSPPRVTLDFTMASYLLDGTFLRQSLLQLLLQFLPGAQGLLDAEKVRQLLQPRISEVFSKMVHALSVHREEFLRRKGEG